MKEGRIGCDKEKGKKEVGKAKEADPFLSSSAFNNRIPKLFIQPSLENFSSFPELLSFSLGGFAVRGHSFVQQSSRFLLQLHVHLWPVSPLQERLLSTSESVRTPAKPYLTEEAHGQPVFT